MLVSALYVVVCRLLELVVLRGRRERTKELKISCSGTNCRLFAGNQRARFELHDR